MRVVVGLLAAGGSTRMRGRDKLMEDVGGEVLLARQLRVAQGFAADVLVALPPDHALRLAIVRNAGASPVTVQTAEPGMGASIAALATEALKMDADALLLMLADMPDIDTDDISALLSTAADAGGETIVRAASADGVAGHPVVFPRVTFPALGRLRGDRGARDVIADSSAVTLVPLQGRRALTDLDTPEEWAAWRASRSD